MAFWLSCQARLLLLFTVCVVLWMVESVVPVYVYGPHRFRRAFPNVGLTALLIVTNLLLAFLSTGVSLWAETRRAGLFYLLDLPSWMRVALGIAALDLFAYVAHVMLHKYATGWRFHRVHHSEREVDVTTAFRQHPGETVLRILLQLPPIAMFGISPWTVIVYLVLSSTNAQFEHANVKVNDALDRWLRVLVVTPNMHKVHHSREVLETDSNYANIFSVWDRMLGTYTAGNDFRKLRYGLDGFDDEEKQSLRGLLKMPFSA